MSEKGHKITRVRSGSIAEEMGVMPGMYLVSVNGFLIEDVFDYHYLMDEAEVQIMIREESGQETLLIIDKEPDEEFGVEFENSLMDNYHSCCNKCVFCFIDQLPPGLRKTLYFKDDDSRLSFLQGNYITLTNMNDRDIDRIIRYHMEPINISIHTTNPALRKWMLGNRFAGDILPKLKKLSDAGVTMNGQIVLCKGINDGEELEHTICDLTKFRPALQSVSVVPAGITKYRENLVNLEPFDCKTAEDVIDRVEGWQKRLAEEVDTDSMHFIHASDEWYILARREIPEEERYDGYPQLENGVGMVRLMETEITAELNRLRDVLYKGNMSEKKNCSLEAKLLKDMGKRGFPVRRITVATGYLMREYLEKYSAWVMEAFPRVVINVCAIHNVFFGDQITVSGLVTGRDLIAQLKSIQNGSIEKNVLGDELLIPINMLRSGEKTFLDDITTDDVIRELGIPVRVVWPGGDKFVQAVLGLPSAEESHRQLYESADGLD